MFDDMIEWSKRKILDTINITPKEAEEIAQRIKRDTMRECSKPLNTIEFNGLYERKILDWCAKQRQ